jgi:hypothetical protein
LPPHYTRIVFLAGLLLHWSLEGQAGEVLTLASDWFFTPDTFTYDLWTALRRAWVPGAPDLEARAAQVTAMEMAQVLQQFMILPMLEWNWRCSVVPSHGRHFFHIRDGDVCLVSPQLEELEKIHPLLLETRYECQPEHAREMFVRA